MTLKQKSLNKFWAKTSDDKETNPDAFHPLICHLIDVANVAQAMWGKVLADAEKSRLAEAIGLGNDLELAGKIIAFIAGLHDLGKCSPPFTLRGHNDPPANQTRRLLDLYKCERFYERTSQPAKEAPHGYVTACELPQILSTEFNFPLGLVNDISKLIGGHHGVFPLETNLLRISAKKFAGNQHWKDARRNLAIKLSRVLKLPKKIDFQGNADFTESDIVILAGLVSVADWIGSNTDFFACEIKDSKTANFDIDFEEYESKSKRQAEEALKNLGWVLDDAEVRIENITSDNLSGEESFGKLFPKIKNRRHLQDMAIEIGKDLTKPGIVIVETPTGEGKTEAAMYLADAWNKNLHLNGYYFALPTQATSNQMFGRVNDFLKNSFPKRNIHNQLLHGHSSLSAEFTSLKDNYRQFINNISDDLCDGDKCTPSVVAAEWFTYKKRGLLAPFGVGTIDQALLAVLQTKHYFVRLFGLAHKTIILDEVHAYDAYMSKILERLLEWLAALGSPVIMLSATLPFEKRKKLLKAYQKGREIKSTELEKGDYPRISYAVGENYRSKKLNTSEKNQRRLKIEQLDEDFIVKLEKKLKDEGGCVAIICNTVARSQELFELLANREFFQGDDKNDGLPKINLLHSHFRYRERREKEDETLLRFGKEGGEVQIIRNGKTVSRKVKRPDFGVLISTQIIEQSLDLDFDLMISEFAPIDLLLQRAGRLQRHERKFRPKNFSADPVLWLIKPQIDEDDSPDFGKSIYVYDKHILLRTWLKLEGIQTISVPQDIEGFIEFVYGKKQVCPDEKHLAIWDESQTEMAKKLKKKEGKAEAKLVAKICIKDIFEAGNLGLDEDDSDTHKSLQALTRDSELPSVSVIILKKDELLELDLSVKPDRKTSEYLLKREAKISRYGLTNSILDDKKLKPTYWKRSPLLRNHRLLILDEKDELKIGKFKIKLDDLFGIVIENMEEK